jgi:hypothetical protein
MEYTKAYKLKKDYPQDVKDQIGLYAVDKNSDLTRLIGSYSYKVENASDIDLLEEVRKEDPNKLIYFFVKGLQKVVNDLMQRQDQIFNEVKAGINHLYKDINIGTCSDNIYNVPNEYFEIMKEYYRRKFITAEEMNIILKVEESKPKTQLEYEIIYDLMRKRYILRWTPPEIMRGYKTLIDINNRAYKYTLNDAVSEKSPINVEGIYINNNNKYVECSNFFWLEYQDKEGNIKILNMPDNMLVDKDEFFGEGLKYSMYTLLYSKYVNYNPFKAIKRFFSYARHFEDAELLKLSYKIINSQLGRLYNMNAQMKTVSKAIKTRGHKPLHMNAIYSQLDLIRWNMQGIILKDFDGSEVIKYLTDVLDKNRKITQKEVSEHLDYLTKNITKYLNITTIKVLESVKLYPLPRYLIPNKRPF